MRIAMVVVRDRSGLLRASSSGAFGKVTHDEGFVPNDGVEFIKWETYCDACYLHQLYAHGKGVWSEVCETGIPTQDDYRRLHGASEGVGATGHARHAGAEAKNLVGDPTPATRVGPPDAAVSSDGPESDIGRDAERGDSLGEAVADDEYGEHLGRRSSRRDLPDCEAWEVYREAS